MQVHALTELKRGVTWEEGPSAEGGGSRLGTHVDGGATHRLTLTSTTDLTLALTPGSNS